MPVQTKRKGSTKKETMSVKNERLRLRHWVMFWVLVAATHALVISIFSNVDVRTLLPVSAVNEEKMTAEEQLVAELRAQVKSLGDKVASVESTEAHPKPATSCLTTTSTAIDTYITYVDKSTNVSASLPYSFSWGDECAPVVLTDAGIWFGPGKSSDNENNSAIRDSELTIGDKRITLSQVKQNLQPGYPGVSEDTNLRERTISGIPVLSFNADGGSHVWYAFGRSFTYILGSDSWLTDAEAIKIIQSLRVTN
jgi:hypothetical protein